jgi:hypothetical protein
MAKDPSNELRTRYSILHPLSSVFSDYAAAPLCSEINISPFLMTIWR